VAFPNKQNLAAGAIPVWIAPPPDATFLHVANATAVLAKTGAGVLLGVTVNTGDSGKSVQIYDGLTAGGTLIGTYDLSAVGGPTLPLAGIPFATGLYVKPSSGSVADFTVTYA
jgi:hypothetical protein